jgi:hypothetical protein
MGDDTGYNSTSKQMKMTDYLPKPKTPVYNSIVENYYLTSPNFRQAIYGTKIVEHAPWGFPGALAAHGSDNGDGKDQEILTELLKKKFDAGKVDKAVEKAWSAVEPYGQGNRSWKHVSGEIYTALAYAEKLLVNPGWEGSYMNESPPIPVTLQDKHLAGTYTQADTDNLERIKSGDMMDRMVDAHGLKGLFGGIHRRKTKKSKRAQKKRKSTRKSKLTRSR